MKIDDILAGIEKDSVIDERDLSLASLKIPQIHAKWQRILFDEVKILQGLELAASEKKRERAEYYLGKAPEQAYIEEPLDLKILRSDLDLYLNSDSVLAEFEAKRQLQKHKIKTIEDFMKLLHNRGFHIKNAIDFQKFLAGLNS